MDSMKVLVACEMSAVVRDAFRRRGHDAWSVDILPTLGDPQWHIQSDIANVIEWKSWDLMVAFPPCTHLAVSGARWWPEKRADGRQEHAVNFVRWLAGAMISRVAIENPVGFLSTAWRKPDQIIQPWQHGHGETKATCLWLKGLPLLTPTNIVSGRSNRIHMMPGTKRQSLLRSMTYPGIADAMAEQWGA